MEVSSVRLKNIGLFVARLNFVYIRNGRMIRTQGSGDITLGRSVTLNPGNYGVPEGVDFYVYAEVAGGKDNVSCESYTYTSSTNTGVAYIISGTTLNNTLKVDRYLQAGCECDSEPNGACIISEQELRSLQSCDINPSPDCWC